MEIELNTIKLLTIVFVILIHITISTLCLNNIKDDIRKYCTVGNVFSITADIFLRKNINYLTFLAWLLFPMYISFKIGSYFGILMYNILIHDKNENRIASWVV